MTAFLLPPKSPDATFADFRHSHVCIRVSDYEVEKSWLVENLDFRVVHEWHEPMLGVQMGYLAAAGDNGTILEIVGGNDPEPSPRAEANFVETFGFQGLHHVCFTVPSVDKTVENLKARDVKVVAEPFEVEAIARRIAFFSDPWGNLFELEEVLT